MSLKTFTVDLRGLRGEVQVDQISNIDFSCTFCESFRDYFNLRGVEITDVPDKTTFIPTLIGSEPENLKTWGDISTVWNRIYQQYDNPEKVITISDREA